MGFLREGINEVIGTTCHNAAPIGFIFRNGKYRLVLFHGSHTAGHIESDGWIVANIVYDPVLYVVTAFDDLPEESFIEENAGEYTVQRLAACEAWAAFSAHVERKTRESLLVSLTPLREEMRGSPVHPVNRGFNSIIEATVHGTRYVISRDPVLLDLIEHYSSVVKKCGGVKELEALDLLFDYIGYP
jgi:uncharacterized protein